MEKLNYQELSTVLAALRNFQQDIEKYGAETMARLFAHFEDVAPLSSEAISDLCERLNFTNETDPKELSMIIRDWRISHDNEAAVPVALRGNYEIKLTQGGHDFIVLKLNTPTGDRSLLHIEAEQDHFKLIIYCPDADWSTETHDECDAICRITRQGLVVYGNSGNSTGLVLQGDNTVQLPAFMLHKLIDTLDGSVEAYEEQVINL